MYYYRLPLKSLNEAATGAILPVYDSNDQVLNESTVKAYIKHKAPSVVETLRAASEGLSLEDLDPTLVASAMLFKTLHAHTKATAARLAATGGTGVKPTGFQRLT